MALADYDTSVEKIAALKAASLDPSIVNLNVWDSNYWTCTELGYVIFSVDVIRMKVSSIVYKVYERDFCPYPCDLILESGEEYLPSEIMSHVNDADIIYANPITKYQDRLAALYITPLTSILQNDSFTTGVNGSIIRQGSNAQIGTDWICQLYGIQSVAIPPGTTISTSSDGYIKYFDVPADW